MPYLNVTVKVHSNDFKLTNFRSSITIVIKGDANLTRIVLKNNKVNTEISIQTQTRSVYKRV